MLLDLNLMQYQPHLKLKSEGGKWMVGDRIRSKFVHLSPEELVRQLLIHYLIEIKNYPKAKIQVEKQIEWNERKFRFDILVYNETIQPFMLVECKSYKVQLEQSVLDQISKYNIEIGAPYLLVSNGQYVACFQLNAEAQEYQLIPEIPDFPVD